ncbi:MAG: Gfo/Idh/MocA family oxidoreductase [Armatimonadota bacterium]
MIGVAVVGLGVGEQHLKAYLDNENCSVVSIYDIDKEKAKAVAGRYGSFSVAGNFEDIIKDKTVDIISIASYDDAHFEQIISAIKENKHLFIEKPLCRTYDELTYIKRSLKDKKGLKLASNLVLRSTPLYKYLKEIITKGDMGKIYSFDGDYLYGRLHKITHGWRRDVENYSVMEGGGVHLVDLMLYLTEEKPSSVIGFGNRICTENTSFRYNDYMASTFLFTSGMIGRITANFGCVHQHQHVVRIFGTKKTFIYDDKGPRMYDKYDPGDEGEKINLSPLPSSKGDLVPGFVTSIVKDEDITSQIQHEFDLISACIASDDSCKENKMKEIKYI